jgi:hypothetical protein
MSPDQFKELMKESERALAGDSVYPTGLLLTEVLYPEEMMKLFTPMYSKLRIG